MSDDNAQSQWMEFTRFVPGFDFLRQLVPAGLAGTSAASGGGAAGMAGPAAAFQHWLAPTLDAGEVQKRIDELRTVKFWLEQNSRALDATIQALEVQKMTLATLRSMNLGAQQFAQAVHEEVGRGMERSAEGAAAWAAAPPAEAAVSTEAPQAPSSASAGPTDAEDAADAQDERAASPGLAELQAAQAQAMQWWGALTEQFQSIASQALDDLGRNMAAATPQAMAEDAAAGGDQPAGQATRTRSPGSAGGAVKKPAAKTVKKTVRQAAKKTAGKTTKTTKAAKPKPAGTAGAPTTGKAPGRKPPAASAPR